ncbi:hypothetical protein EGI11_09445 [Chryseobacterium sp. H3056]|uniref:Uncharacterized protein n=1 Tax=Kaistella daneshvariae TaxID=2487074 RepID=A0A3N0WS12_9FLAO|nr:hypothetical protein EGI11_09445 [Kaistella daneshvariae]
MTLCCKNSFFEKLDIAKLLSQKNFLLKQDFFGFCKNDHFRYKFFFENLDAARIQSEKIRY